MRMLAAVLFVGLVGVAYAGDPALPGGAQSGNGLYWLARQGPTLPQVEGGPLAIGAPYKPKVQSALLVSESNANDRYTLQLVCDYAASAASKRPVLVVNKTAFRYTASGGSEKEGQQWAFRIVGRSHAQAVAKHFGAKVLDRRHPGFKFRVAMDPVGTWRIGAAQEVELTIENVGSKPVMFAVGGMNRGARDNQFSFVARGGPGYKAIPDSGDGVHFGGPLVHKVLRPGDVHRQRVDIRDWFKLVGGMYEFIGTYHMEFHDPDDADRVYPIWECPVAAAFVAQVAAAK